MGSIFTQLFVFLLLLLLMPSDCSGIRDGEEKATDDACVMSCNSAGDAHRIQLRFNHSHGEVTPVDLDANYQSYLAINRLNSRSLPILCTVTKYETAYGAEINEVIRRTKATVHCALPAKPKSTMKNESSTSYMSRHMYEISRQIASLIGTYQWLKPGSGVYEESDRVCDLDIVNLNMNNITNQNGVEIIQMAATLSFSTTRPLQYYTELIIAVPVRSIPTQFLNISNDENHKETRITGFWIDIFEAAVEMLPVANTTYKLVPFYGSDDQLLKEVARKTFDAAIGLTVITEDPLQLVEFLYPHFRVGPVIVMMKENIELYQVFSFMRPFTYEMWLTMVVLTIFTVFVIWLLEHKTISETGGVPSRQVGAIFWFSFASLFYGAHRESPRKSLTYFVLAPWSFLLLIVGSVYVASFTSMVTSTDTQESCSSSIDIKDLIKTNAIIGCDGDPIITRFLVETIGFQQENIKIIDQSSIDNYAKALSSGYIKAAFILRPYAELFLTKYCKGFQEWFPPFNIELRGSAVVLPRRSPLVPSMTEAMVRLMQSRKFEQMRKDMLSFSRCSGSNTDGTYKQGIGPEPFLGLFILSGGASAIAILVTVISMMRRRLENSIQRMLMGRGLWVWLTALLSRNQGRSEVEL